MCELRHVWERERSESESANLSKQTDGEQEVSESSDQGPQESLMTFTLLKFIVGVVTLECRVVVRQEVNVCMCVSQVSLPRADQCTQDL